MELIQKRNKVLQIKRLLSQLYLVLCQFSKQKERDKMLKIVVSLRLRWICQRWMKQDCRSHDLHRILVEEEKRLWTIKRFVIFRIKIPLTFSHLRSSSRIYKWTKHMKFKYSFAISQKLREESEFFNHNLRNSESTTTWKVRLQLVWRWNWSLHSKRKSWKIMRIAWRLFQIMDMKRTSLSMRSQQAGKLSLSHSLT